ncbi:MAG: PAS domain S-box protein, partial [Bacillota bacterium]
MMANLPNSEHQPNGGEEQIQRFLDASHAQSQDPRLLPEAVDRIRREAEERRMAEQASRDNEARLKAIVNTAVDGIITIDERGIIETINPAAERIFGYSPAELIGQNVKMLMPNPYHDEHDQYLANYCRTGQRKIIGIGREVLGKRKDGTIFPIDLAVSEVLLGNRRIFTGIVRDVTARKQAEEELRKAKELAEQSWVEAETQREIAEAANRAKDHFLAVLSHELRTPLTPVLAMVAFVESQVNLPEELRDEIGTIRRNVEMEARLIDDLLDLTRISKGKIHLQCEVVDAHASLRSALEITQSDIE